MEHIDICKYCDCNNDISKEDSGSLLPVNQDLKLCKLYAIYLTNYSLPTKHPVEIVVLMIK